MYKSPGFTLVELLVVLTLSAILLSMAIPSFMGLIQAHNISSAVTAFISDLRYARSASIVHGGGVVMCRSNSPEATNPVCHTTSGPGGNGWRSGWIIFHDLNRDGQRDDGSPDPVEPVFRVKSALTNINSIVEGSGASTKFRFTATGRLNLSGSTSLQFGGDGDFAGEVQRVVCVNLSGRARISGDGFTSCSTDR